jgi:hypothetical protein
VFAGIYYNKWQQAFKYPFREYITKETKKPVQPIDGSKA